MTPLLLYQKHTQAELEALLSTIRADPANKTAPGSFYLYLPKARKRIDAIVSAITLHMADTRANKEIRDTVDKAARTA
jgi:hypothetical protein